jgi:probable F420-dependent oxidoreductase
MDFGVAIFTTDFTIDPARLAAAAEAAGFESLFVPEHTHIPAGRETPWPGGPELPPQYFHLHDPFVALTAAAAATERLRLGTGICLVVERDPIVTAKLVASLDHLSGGRVEFGVGAGWNLEEMSNHGTDPARRFGVLRERCLAMRTIWTEDEPEFHGRHVDFDPIWSWPKPVQRPHPPVLVGGNGAKVHDRVLEYGDAWMPNMKDLDGLGERIAELRRRGEEAGRGRIGVTYFGAREDDEQVERLAEAGVDRCLFMLPPRGEDEVLERLAACAELAARHR